MTQNQAGQARLIPLRPDVQSRTCLGKTRIYELIAANEFPQPVRLGRRIAFVEQEIDTWILQRMAERV
jgi:prophage regulatory protein